MSKQLDLAKKLDKQHFVSAQDKLDALDDIINDLKEYYVIEKDREAQKFVWSHKNFVVENYNEQFLMTQFRLHEKRRQFREMEIIKYENAK